MSLYTACSGRIFSHNYPENYENQLYFNWLVHAYDENSIKIDLNVDGIASNDYFKYV